MSSKPGTYMVQTMFPALALGVAIVVTTESGFGKRPLWSLFTTWPTYFAALPLAIFAAIYFFTGEVPGVVTSVLIALIAALFIWSGRLGLGRPASPLGRDRGRGARALRRHAARRRAAEHRKDLARARDREGDCELSGQGRSAHRLPRALRPLPARHSARAAVAGSRGAGGGRQGSKAVYRRRPLAKAYELGAAIELAGAAAAPVGCVSAYNTMRGCPLHFRIYSPKPAEPCTVPEAFACRENAPPAGPEKPGDCD